MNIGYYKLLAMRAFLTTFIFLVLISSSSLFSTASAFTDVPKGHWSEGAVKKITQEYKIMSGYPNNTFGGKNTVNRYEMAVMLSKILAASEKEFDKDREDLASLLEVMELFQSEIKVLKQEIKKRDTKIDGFAAENQRLRNDIAVIKQDFEERQRKELEKSKPQPKKKKTGFWIFGRKKKESPQIPQQPSTMNSDTFPPPLPGAIPDYEY